MNRWALRTFPGGDSTECSHRLRACCRASGDRRREVGGFSLTAPYPKIHSTNLCREAGEHAIRPSNAQCSLGLQSEATLLSGLRVTHA